VENAIDAGSSHVVIELEDGGTVRITVSDDGEGMRAEDLPLVFERYTTSKIRTEDDLYAVRTLGFRGEALASIAAVSRVTLTSARRGEAGARIEVSGGVPGEVKPEGAPVGTTVTVRDLFFNTPARRKFLRKQSTELGHVTALVQNLALTHPEIHFELTHNARRIFTLPAVSDVRERVAGFFGPELARDLIDLEHEGETLRLSALLAPRRHTRTNTRGQFVFVNGRWVRDRLLIGAVNQAYRGFVESGRYPMAFLFVEIDPAEVDVNVHPSKLEIRFRNSSAVYTAVLGALRARLDEAWPREGLEVDPGTMEERRARIRQKIGDFFLRSERPQGQSTLFRPEGAGGAGGTAPAPGVMPARPMLPVRGVMQVHNTYLVEETDDGLRISDQHALHERVLYGEILRKLADSPLASQQMLTAQMMSVTEQDVLTVEEHAELFTRVGLDVKPAGPRTLAVNAVPQVLDVDDAPALIRDVLDRLQDDTEERSFDERLAEIAETLACRAAVKAGDELSRPEIESLLKRAGEPGVRETCPHGRPTTLHFTLKELEQQFGRK